MCIRLEEAILGAKVLFIKDVKSFFKTLIDVPEDNMVELSMQFLERLYALDESKNITPLGLHLARIPCSPQIGKMILMASVFSCFDPITSIAASLSFKSPFYSVLGNLFLSFSMKLQFYNFFFQAKKKKSIRSN